MQIIGVYKCKDNRYRAYVKLDDGTTSTVSYPRILMEEKLGRPLEPYEDVHHKDGNYENNDLDNLEIVIHGEHQRLHSTKYHDIKATCQVCQKEFIWTAKRQRYYYMDLHRGRKRIISCSASCSNYYGRQEQLGRNIQAECELNGEASPNGNTVPNNLI